MTIRDPELIRQWRDGGYAVLRRVIPYDLIDRLNRDVAAFRATCGETKDDHGFGQRIGLFHIQNDNSLQVALHPGVREFLAFALQDESLLYGSLSGFYERVARRAGVCRARGQEPWRSCSASTRACGSTCTSTCCGWMECMGESRVRGRRCLPSSGK